jgi:hypothetical protein
MITLRIDPARSRQFPTQQGKTVDDFWGVFEAGKKSWHGAPP